MLRAKHGALFLYCVFFFNRKRGYHVFVRKFKESETVVVDNLKASDKGERLITALEDKIGQLPSGCEFMCGSKKV